MNEDELAKVHFAELGATLLGKTVRPLKDGTKYVFYRGKKRGSSENSAPRFLVVVEATGVVRSSRAIGSYERKKLMHFCKKCNK